MQDTPIQKISRPALQEVADFLPYPFIVSENFGDQHLNTYLNEKFLEEIGYTLSEIPTIQSWYAHAYPDEAYRNKVIQHWNTEERESQSHEHAFVKGKSLVTCKNGNKKWYEIKASVINNIHVIAFIDLDKEIALQQKLQNINTNNDRMLSILGHDLRSPVANLMAISSMAANTEISNAEFTALIGQVNLQSIQVLDLLDRTLSWAKLNFNDITKQNVSIDVASMIADILEIYKASYEVKKIVFTVDIQTINIDSDLEILTIIVRNLISNAIKFTHPNGTIAISCNNQGLTIADHGIGMTGEMLANILNDTAVSRRGTGNELGIGMGLQLVKKLAEKISGKLFIESEPGFGTSVGWRFNTTWNKKGVRN